MNVDGLPVAAILLGRTGMTSAQVLSGSLRPRSKMPRQIRRTTLLNHAYNFHLSGCLRSLAQSEMPIFARLAN